METLLRFHVPGRMFSASCKTLFTTRSLSSVSVAMPAHRILLSHRTVLRVEGRDTIKFLQNLVTNDLNALSTAKPCMWAAVLNTLGRVLFDVFVHLPRTSVLDGQPPTSLLVDCDVNAVDPLLAHFKKYKVRSKVSFNLVDGLVVHSVLGATTASPFLSDPCSTLSSITSDPRLNLMGVRIIGPSDLTGTALGEVPSQAISAYHQHRYRLGVPEGMQDLAYGVAFPLESNFDILNGVNFDKGCYLGQELTARSRYVGVIRKRLMPITIPSGLTTDSMPPPGTPITSNGKSVGKFQCGDGHVGLALLRLASVSGEAAQKLQIEMQDRSPVEVQTMIPFWWPKQNNTQS